MDGIPTGKTTIDGGRVQELVDSGMPMYKAKEQARREAGDPLAQPTPPAPVLDIDAIDAMLAERSLISVRSYFDLITTALHDGNEVIVQTQAEFLRHDLERTPPAERGPMVAELIALIGTLPEAEQRQLYELCGVERPAEAGPDVLTAGVYSLYFEQAKSANGDKPQVTRNFLKRLMLEDPLVIEYYLQLWADAGIYPRSVLKKTISHLQSEAKAAALAERKAEREEARRERERTIKKVAVPAAAPPGDLREIPFNLTDLGNAQRYAAWFGHVVKYVPEFGWLVFTGQCYERGDVAAQRLAKEVPRRIYAEAGRGADADERATIAEHAIKSESAARIAALMELAKSEPEISAKACDFDVDHYLLNVGNGTLDLRNGQLRTHNAGDRLTKIAGTYFDESATCPTFLSFLDRIFGGNAALIAFIRRVIGYSLTGDCSEQCLFVLWGTGANGKSTLLEIIRAMLGNYAQQAEFSAFLTRPNDTIRNDLARMTGARFIAAVESGEGRRLAETMIKALTGGDTITARYLFKEYFEFRPAFKLWLATNHKPQIRGTDNAIWRRIKLVPFEVTIPEAERDRKLLAKLRNELPGILAWAVRGCLEWQRDGLGTPAEIRAATDSYKAEQDILAAFLSECCVILPTAVARSADLYAAYKRWGGENVESQKSFSQRLAERGYMPDKGTGGVRLWKGIGLLGSGANGTSGTNSP